MLMDNHICKLQSQFFPQMQEQHMQNLHGKEISLLMPLSAMFAKNTDMQYNFACEAYKELVSRGICADTVFQSNYYQLAVYGVLLSNFVLGYNLKTGKTALYTSSYRLLTNLATRGILVGKRSPIAVEISTFEDVLVSGTKIPRSFKTNTAVQAIRLDWEYAGGKLVFKGSVPKKQLDLRETVLIPYTAVDRAMSIINGYLQESVFEVVMGDKVRYITKNTGVLKMIYGEQRAKHLISNSNYDARTFMFNAPSVGASIYSSGITNIDFASVDQIRVVESVMDIDMSEVKLDTSRANEFVANKIRNHSMTPEQMLKLAELLEVKIPTANGVDITNPLLKALTFVQSYKVYDAMKLMPEVFNIAEYKQMPTRYGSAEQVSIPATKEEFDAMLKESVYRVSIRTSTGKTACVVCTNSPAILSKLYGKDYFTKMESEGSRLRRLDYILKKRYPNGISDTALLQEVKNLDLMLLYQHIYMVTNVELDFYTYEQLHNAILLAVQEVDNRKTVVRQYDNTIVRNCECDANAVRPANYYRSINFKTVTSMIKLTIV